MKSATHYLLALLLAALAGTVFAQDTGTAAEDDMKRRLDALRRVAPSLAGTETPPPATPPPASGDIQPGDPRYFNADAAANRAAREAREMGNAIVGPEPPSSIPPDPPDPPEVGDEIQQKIKELVAEVLALYPPTRIEDITTYPRDPDKKGREFTLRKWSDIDDVFGHCVAAGWEWAINNECPDPTEIEACRLENERLRAENERLREQLGTCPTDLEACQREVKSLKALIELLMKWRDGGTPTTPSPTPN